MALQYALTPLKILLSLPVIMETAFCLFFKQKALSNETEMSFSSVLSSALKSFFHAIFSCKFTSQYAFVNHYIAIATTQGSGGGGGGGHGKDDWVMPVYSHPCYESMIQKNYNSKLHFITP